MKRKSNGINRRTREIITRRKFCTRNPEVSTASNNKRRVSSAIVLYVLCVVILFERWKNTWPPTDSTVRHLSTVKSSCPGDPRWPKTVSRTATVEDIDVMQYQELRTSCSRVGERRGFTALPKRPFASEFLTARTPVLCLGKTLHSWLFGHI
jgi:hypothetical protein